MELDNSIIIQVATTYSIHYDSVKEDEINTSDIFLDV